MGRALRLTVKSLRSGGGPYRIQFILEAPYSRSPARMEIKDITVTGMETGKIWRLGDVFTEKVNDPRSVGVSDGGYTMIASSENLVGEIYESYKLTAYIIINIDDAVMEKRISIVLETDYKVERRSDSFDRSTGV